MPEGDGPADIAVTAPHRQEALADGAIEGNIGWLLVALEYSGARGVKVMRTPSSSEPVYSIS